MASELFLFVYGTLKRDQCAHARFCEDAVFVATATVRGVLRLHADGYPVLVVPESDVQALGTIDPDADAALASRLTPRPSTPPASPPGRWRSIHGEIFSFAAPRAAIGILDTYEGADFSASAVYRRVLLPVDTVPLIRHAWAYAAATTPDVTAMRPLAADSWP